MIPKRLPSFLLEEKMYKPKTLHIGTAGIPNCLKKSSYPEALEYNKRNGLMGMEMEFVRGVRMKDTNIPLIKNFVDTYNMIITAHGPFYVNLNAQEEDKYEASVKRILDTARVAYQCGGYSITFHAAFYLKQDPKKVYQRVKESLTEIVHTLKAENIDIWIRPELTGKATQFGNLEELIQLSKDVEMVLPCIDFSHMHARLNGYNGYENFCSILEKLKQDLGQEALDNFHGHVAGIDYGPKGERKHLNFADADFAYKDLMKALHDYGVKGILICESPNIEEDAKLLHNIYSKL